MNCFLAKIIYRIICGDGRHTPQFDEQLRLVIAHTYEEAIGKAMEIGKAEAHAFYNQNKKLVQWEFINVSEIFSLAGHADGAEISSVIKEPADAGIYIDHINSKAKYLKANAAYHFIAPTLN